MRGNGSNKQTGVQGQGRERVHGAVERMQERKERRFVHCAHRELAGC